jgi:hypothetical protein
MLANKALAASKGTSVYSGNIAIAHSITPYISVYPWSSGFGTKYSDPATLPTGTGRSVAFSPA